MLKVKIKPLHPLFEMPQKAFPTDSGYDAKVVEITHTSDGGIVLYLGFSTEIKEGWKGVIVPRSSLTKTGWVMQNSPGQIDSTYRGEWMMKLKHISSEYNIRIGEQIKTPFNIGDKVCQIYFEPVWETELIQCETLSETERGDGGFGHTGK